MITALPEPRPVFDVPVLRWGILGTGWIADKFVSALRASTQQRVVAVGSRSREGAARFAAGHGIETVHASYEALVGDPNVDVVYVASPHPAHLEHGLLAIGAGKHVLIEKPLGLNAAQARQLAEAAQAAEVFAAEALWSLALPKFDVLGQLLADGVLGEIAAVQADIGEWLPEGHRIFDRALAGGCMLDLATYPVMFAHWVAGMPDEVVAVGTRHPGGTVSTASMALRFSSGVQASLQASATHATPTTAAVGGSDALLHLEGPFYQPGPFTLVQREGPALRYEEEPIAHAGLFHQALQVALAIGEGRTEAPHRPLSASVATLEIMDRVRAATGDQFDME